MCSGKVLQVGIYDSESEAARSWDAAALHYRGDSTALNFEDSPDDPAFLSDSLKRTLDNASSSPPVRGTHSLSIVQ